MKLGYAVKRIKRVPLVGNALYRAAVWLCGKLTGHPAQDFGWAMSGNVDVWCRYCDRFAQIDPNSASEEVRSMIYKMTGKDIRQKAAAIERELRG